jgi:hypothetical protein
LGASPGSAGCFKKPTQIPIAMLDIPFMMHYIEMDAHPLPKVIGPVPDFYVITNAVKIENVGI